MRDYPRDVSEEEKAIYEAVEPFTMTSIERVISLIRATRYLIDNDIPGQFVECGVWRGGSMMVVALVLKAMERVDRQLLLFDTFAGMSAPTGRDTRFDGAPASALLAAAPPQSWMRGYASIEDVTANLLSTGYPMENIRLIEGQVEHTIPTHAPSAICLLRLDTDWYESTKHELLHLYPRLANRGILIIDDYGHWRGAREATDEYFSGIRPAPYLHRLDYTGRLIVKP